MSRRSVSPIGRASMEINQNSFDERDLIINKLKDELVFARSKEKEVVIL